MSSHRLAKARQAMADRDIDCLALVPGFNMRYLTGLDLLLFERPFIAFFPADPARHPVVVIPALEAPAWNEHAPFEAQLIPWGDADGPDEALRLAATALGEVRTLAVEYLRMRVLEHDLIRRFLPDVSMAKAECVLAPLRLQKDAVEIAAHRRAARSLESALEQLLPAVKPGGTERELCARLTSLILASGGESIFVEPLVLSGPRSAGPHNRSGQRRIEPGDLLLFDYVTTVDGYYADLTRTFVVGRGPDSEQRRVYEAVKAANEAGRAAARPGATCQAVDRAARAVLRAAGLGDNFLHRTGHGLGLEVHEDPSIVEGNDTVLQEGMVFTVEPGAYVEGWGGVRIEDNVVVTATGSESLTTFVRDLQVIG